MTTTHANVLADSISPATGDRLTTFEVTVPKYLLGQLAKHRQLSMNFESSRAKPFWKVLEQVANDPYVPTRYGLYGSGMTPAEYVDGSHNHLESKWRHACADAVMAGIAFAYAGKSPHVGRWSDLYDSVIDGAFDPTPFKETKPVVAKETANRLLEPFMWVSGIISATEWANFIELRTASDAQSDIQDLANSIRDGLDLSSPVARHVHLPYPHLDETGNVERIARVSYGTHNQVSARPQGELFEQLVAGGHWSPFEHVAISDSGPVLGNFKGWRQLRHELGSK